MKKAFIGITNIKFIIRELIKMVSSQESFFSLKRFQIATAFIVFIYGSLLYLHIHIRQMTAADFVMWATPLLLICGYTLNAMVNQQNIQNK